MRYRIIFLPILLLFGISVYAEDQWYPSKWGADDQIGAMNNITPARVLKAVQLVKLGKTVPLALQADISPLYPSKHGRARLI